MAKQKQQGAEFEIPDYRKDPRYITQQSKLAKLHGRVLELHKAIETIQKEKPNSDIEQAHKMIRGEPATPPRNERLEAAFSELRIVEKAIPIQEHTVEMTRLSVCGEISKNPDLIEAIHQVFRNTGRIMLELYAAMENEDRLFRKIQIAGLDRCRAEWIIHPIFQSLKGGGLTYADCPIKAYLTWSKKYFGG